MPSEWSPGTLSLTRRFHLAVRHVRDVDARRPLVWDLLLTGVLALAALADLLGERWKLTAHGTDVPGWLPWLVSAGFVLPVAWRRRGPLAVMCVLAVPGFVDSWTGIALEVGVARLVLLYGIAVRRPWRELVWAGALAVAQITVGALRWPEGDFDRQLVPNLMTCAVVVLGGFAVRTRRDYTASLLERARQLEVERDQQAQLATAAERARIAREMHDIIGHHLSVITGLADGGSYASRKNPERATQALEAIGDTSREALGELRKLLGMLRDATVDLAPQPALADLDQLLGRVREAGLPVRVTTSGRGGELSPGLQLAVYRIVQEALTNTLKHAGPGASAEVTLGYAPHGVDLGITDTGVGAASGGPDDGGQGLPGMRQRAALYGGTLAAGPLPSGGWRVHVHLPAERSGQQ
ncbi:sensor histidine kinase [Streptomyces sp. ME19-01-6]|uniref:sensor histidine kinase n=1 Tax=Streptomyces sp. ME19-01-6 TaxID=3028686 RepID=UPI0029A72D18|nr:histidine kinase [Streptomyces sp. ME19-01-6]MDX3230865.1 histidine kinase [Streptomyces sp. ME19-01-6]